MGHQFRLGHRRISTFLGCIECMRYRVLLSTCAVYVCKSVCHAAQLGFTVWGSFGAAFAKPFWPLVVFFVLFFTSGCQCYCI